MAFLGLVVLAGYFQVLGWLSVPLLLAAAALLAFVVYLLAKLLRSAVIRLYLTRAPGEWLPRRKRPQLPDTEPLYPQVALGYRCWSLGVNGELRAIVDAPVWKPGRNVACCYPNGGHPAPGESCHCGFNCFDWIGDAESRYGGPGRISGAIIGAGDMRVHTTGFRSEFAAVIALKRPSAGEYMAAAEKAARSYAVPLVKTNRQLRKLARRAGYRHVPRNLRPRAEFSFDELIETVLFNMSMPFAVLLGANMALWPVAILSPLALITAFSFPLITLIGGAALGLSVVLDGLYMTGALCVSAVTRLTRPRT